MGSFADVRCEATVLNLDRFITSFKLLNKDFKFF